MAGRMKGRVVLASVLLGARIVLARPADAETGPAALALPREQQVPSQGPRHHWMLRCRQTPRQERQMPCAAAVEEVKIPPGPLLALVG